MFMQTHKATAQAVADTTAKEGQNAPDGIASKLRANPRLFHLLVLIMVAVAFAAGAYWVDEGNKIYIEKAEISAPIISISPSAPGTIEKVYVEEGDAVLPNHRLALIGGKELRAMTKGIVVAVKDAPGQLATAQDAIVKIVDPRKLRVVGRVAENKGLSDIKPGQKVAFTVDAYGARQYEGVVEKIAETARQTDVVFSISDKRETREFEITAYFDYMSYPELKNGMSAKMWIYKK